MTTLRPPLSWAQPGSICGVIRSHPGPDPIRLVLTVAALALLGCGDDGATLPATADVDFVHVAGDVGSSGSAWLPVPVEPDDIAATGPDDSADSYTGDTGSDASDVSDAHGTPTADTHDAGPPFDPELCQSTAGLELYEQRIEPLISGDQPKTCNQCHLSGIDLGLYARGEPCRTMACLVESGEVDLASPTLSKLLGRILMADPASGLITQEIIDAEYEGVLEWIAWSASCHEHVCGEVEDPCATDGPGPAEPGDTTTPLGACDHDGLVATFEERVFRWRSRCAHCHELCGGAFPCWMITDFDEELPETVTEAAALTMFNLIGIDALDVEDPLASRMITKPLALSAGGTEHGGGNKFDDVYDQAYQDFAIWVAGYSACFHGEQPDVPVARVLQPKHKKKHTAGVPITFEGTGADPEDGAIAAESLVWTSEALEEPFGTGPGPFEASLPVGDQVVTLTATDADGNSAQWHVIARVKDATE